MKEKPKEKPKLLIVEDDQWFRKSLEVVLKKYFDIDQAGSEDKALELLAEKDYLIVSTDGAFPKHEGGYVGNHGVLHDSDYRGNTVAKAAKEKGSFVIGLSTEPERLTEPHIIMSKKGLDLMFHVKYLKQVVERLDYE